MTQNSLQLVYEGLRFGSFDLQSRGPGWQVETGRMDNLTTSKTTTNNNIPPQLPIISAHVYAYVLFYHNGEFSRYCLINLHNLSLLQVLQSRTCSE